MQRSEIRSRHVIAVWSKLSILTRRFDTAPFACAALFLLCSSPALAAGGMFAPLGDMVMAAFRSMVDDLGKPMMLTGMAFSILAAKLKLGSVGVAVMCAICGLVLYNLEPIANTFWP